jgi:hypothetical protein
MKKVFLIIIGVFIVILTVGGAYWFQRSKARLFPTTGSKITVSITPQPDTSSPEPTTNPNLNDNNSVGRKHPLDDILITDMRICDNDSDCVPEPTCHSEICINEKHLGNYPDKSTLQCTEIFTPCEATAKSCLCQNRRCVNTRLDTPTCMDYKEELNK